ncbi:MAG: dihydroneopterin aldolase [Puniceicoccales bacterium]|jgi:FolB domain-containing protein|nr:dihydroneopterin aldolase [Puniceicoccales bacterium]
MDDKIFINDIEIFAKHGLLPMEKLNRQKFLVSVRAKFDASMAKVSDNISHTVDYSELLDAVVHAVENSSFNLIERLSNHIAHEVFEKFRLITCLEVIVKKFPDSMVNRKFSTIGFSSTFVRNEK